MSEPTETVTPVEAEAAPAAPPVLQFVMVHSMVRRQATRLLRHQAAQHHRFKQYILPQMYRLIRGRAVKITWAQMVDNLTELLKKEQQGILECRLPNGQKVNLKALQDMQAFTAAPSEDVLKEVTAAPSVPPLAPHPPLDSAANDIPSGNPMPNLPGGAALQDPAAERAVARLAAEKAQEARRKSGEDTLPETQPEGAAPALVEPAVEPPVAAEPEVVEPVKPTVAEEVPAAHDHLPATKPGHNKPKKGHH